ncbi:hypothetical protein ACN28S_03785 [Cystobacter fuscus]
MHALPLLNPDGAERFQRRNAQGIDINRDALALQTPEGRTLKAVRDRLQPALGFNLHDQSWRTAVGDSGRPASISVLAPPLTPRATTTPGGCSPRRSAPSSATPWSRSSPARLAASMTPSRRAPSATTWGAGARPPCSSRRALALARAR